MSPAAMDSYKIDYSALATEGCADAVNCFRQRRLALWN